MTATPSKRSSIVQLVARAAVGLGLGLWFFLGVEALSGVVLFPLPQLAALLCAVGAIFCDRAPVRRLSPAARALIAYHVGMVVIAGLADTAGVALPAAVIIAAGAAFAVMVSYLRPQFSLSLDTPWGDRTGRPGPETSQVRTVGRPSKPS